MTSEFPSSLQPDALMAHMRALCVDIGPRPSTSDRERAAAETVKATLREAGLSDLDEQPFKSQPSYGWIIIPITLAGVLAVPLAGLLGTPGKLVGGAIFLVGAFTMWGFGLALPPFYQPLIARGRSQNIIARVPPTGKVKRTLYLVGHLDTNKQRFLAPPAYPALMKPLVTFSTLLAVFGALTLLLDAAMGRAGVGWWQWAVSGLLLLSLPGTISDELQPHVEGANDNATAVAVLLGMAEGLRAAPLARTEVVLLFTGCEEVVCVGIESYLRRFKPPREDTFWIDLEMVGTGNLCYVTKHGVSYLTPYRPHPQMASLAAQAARKHPDLRVAGKPMLILEEVANLRRRGYNALCVAGYGPDGYLPNWHRLTDTLDKIEPETLSRAARFTWALAQEVDALPD